MVLTRALHCLTSKWKNMMHLPHIFTLSMCFLCPSNTTLIPSHAKKPSLTLAEHCKINHHTTIRLGKAVPHTSGTQQDKPPHSHPSRKSRPNTSGTLQDKPPHYHPSLERRPSHSGTQQDKPPHYHPSPKSRTQHTSGTQQDKPPHYHPSRRSRPSH